jgi:hypothetical protein
LTLLPLKAILDFINPSLFSPLTSLALAGLVLTYLSLASNVLTETVSVPVVSSIKGAKEDFFVIEFILVLIVLLS